MSTAPRGRARAAQVFFASGGPREKEEEKKRLFRNFSFSAFQQSCQIFLGTKYQNRKTYTKCPYSIQNGHKFTKWL
jgi:hypothetical protein